MDDFDFPNNQLKFEDQTMLYANSEESSYNAPMLVSWMYKNIDQVPTLLRGMSILLNQLETGDGCILMMKHDVINTLIRIHKTHRNELELQYYCVAALIKLLDCNYTRDKIISNSIDSLRMAFAIGHYNMSSSKHVDLAIQCITQCSRSEICRVDILNRGLIPYIVHFCSLHNKIPSILRYSLKLFNWVSTTKVRMIYLYEIGAIKMTLKAMKKHITNGSVLAPAMLFLTRSSSMHKPAMEYVIKRKAISLVINAIKSLYNEEAIQLEGLKMLQELSKSREGYNQITDTPGGWQSICQGTSFGDILLHDLPGDLHNPGWCIGETPFLPELERNKLLVAQTEQQQRNAGNLRTWTSNQLQEFMGKSNTEKTLKINTELDEVYLELITTLDLLPINNESKEDWYSRTHVYEKENEISLDEMALTILAIKKKESKQKLISKGVIVSKDKEIDKPIYVMGEQVTSQSLLLKDKSIEEALYGIL